MSETTVQIVGHVGTIICLILNFLNVGVFIFNLFKGRAHRIRYIRNYKKGSFFINYLIMLLIFLVGLIYRERDVILAIASLVPMAGDILVLKVNMSHISGYIAVSLLYKVTAYFGYLLLLLGTVLLTLSIIQQNVWNTLISIKAKFTKKDLLYVLGYSQDNFNIIKSDGKKRFKCVVAKMDKETLEKLYIEGVSYVCGDEEDWIKKNLSLFIPAENKRRSFLDKIFTKYQKNKIVIINTGDDKRNIEICKEFAESIENSTNEVQTEIFKKLKIFVFGDPKYQAIYDNLVDKGMGSISYVNKYQKIAMELFDKYPLSLFMDCKQIDFNTSLVKEDVDINVALIGFGKTNRQILLSSVAINQFITSSNNETVAKPVKYFIFDKEHSENNKNLNHDYFRFRHKLENINLNEYLPMPSNPAEESYLCIDINEPNFYPNLKKIVTRSKRDANFIVIAFGSDLENIDMAQKLVDKCREWDASDVTIFVRAFNWRKEQTPLKDKNCYFFGDETSSVFNIDKILSNKIYEMAKMRSKALDMERVLSRADYDVDSADYQRISNSTEDELWYKNKTQIQRASSIFGCLGLRFKLNLMGLDYREKGTCKDGVKVYNEKEYLGIYAGEDTPNTDKIKSVVNGKKIVYYDGEYQKSRRRNMAVQEHCRWSSFVISRGIVPATIENITKETKEVDGKQKRTSGKNYDLRRHGNLTSYEGLIDFTKLIEDSNNDIQNLNKVYEKDRYRYRYQILDDAFWLLNSNGFEIVSKISCRDNKTCDKLHGCVECNKLKRQNQKD